MPKKMSVMQDRHARSDLVERALLGRRAAAHVRRQAEQHEDGQQRTREDSRASGPEAAVATLEMPM